MNLGGRVVAESLRRIQGEPTMPDEDFEELVREWVASVPPRTEPYTLSDLRKAKRELNAGIFAIMPHIDKPYPDDPRWTPYTRFVESRLKLLDHIIERLIVDEAKS